MPHRRPFGRTALLIALALVAVSCTDEPPARREAPAAATCPDRVLGCVEVGPEERVRIGTLLTVIGENAGVGRDARNGVRLAADFLTPPMQLLGHEIRWIDQDDSCGHFFDPSVFADVAAVVGPTCGSTPDGSADWLLKQGIVLVSPSNSGPALTHPETHHPFYLRTMHNDKIQGHATADFAFNVTGARRAATIQDGSPYSDELQEAFAQTFRRLGGAIAAQKALQVGDTDFLPLLKDLAAKNIDFLYFPIFVAEGGLIARQARTLPKLKDTDLAASDGVFTPDFIEAAGAENAEGMYVSAPDITGFRGDRFYQEEVLPAYERRFGKKMLFDFPRAYAFDAARLVFEAIEQVGIRTPNGGLLIPRAGVRDAMYATKDFPGLTGTLSCNQYGDCQPEATISIYRIGDGEFGKPVLKQTFRLEEI